jgi:hypothetical protein
MKLVDKIKPYQYYLPTELKHALLVLRRKKYWERQGIIFIHIPKAAGVSINNALYGRFMGHTTACQIRRYAPKIFQQYPSFAITRNPWARCVSAYRFIQRGTGHGDGPIAGVHDKEKYRIPEFRSFEYFVKEWLIYQNINDIDYVFRPQLPFISTPDGNIIVSHVGKIEDIKTVNKFISDTLCKEVKIGYQNRTGKSVRYHEWYNSDLVDLISKIYKKDIETFRYTFE